MLKEMKPGRRYFIINIDEPYAEKIYEILKQGQMKKGEWPEGDISFKEWKLQTFDCEVKEMVHTFDPKKIYADWIMLTDDVFDMAMDLLNKRNKAFFPKPYLKDVIFFQQRMARLWSEKLGGYLLCPNASEDEKAYCYGLACAYYPEGHPEKDKAIERGWPWDRKEVRVFEGDGGRG